MLASASGKVLRLLGFTAVLLTLSACGGASKSSNADLPSFDLFVGTQPFGTIFVAEDQGFFEEEGISVNVRRFSSGTEATEAFRAAGAGLFVAGDMPSILSWENGDVVGVAPISADTTTFSIVAAGSVGTAEDLRGKKIATVAGSTGDVFIRSYLKENGISVDDVDLLNLGPGDMAAALARGDIDAFAWLGAEVTKGVEATKNAHILQEGTEGYVVNHIILSATKDSLEREEAIQKVLRALKRAEDVVNTDPDGAVKSIVAVTGMEESTARADIERIKYNMAYTSDFTDEMAAIIDVSVGAGFLKTPMNLADNFDTKSLSSVDKALMEVEK